MNILKNSQKRHEIKFIINEKQRMYFIQRQNLKKLYPDRIIESLYFDKKKLDFFNLSEEGVTPRLKVRIRGYDEGILNNLEIKTTNNYHREKIVIKEFNNDNYNLHSTLRKLGISSILQKKIRVKYKRSYYKLDNIGRVTIDRNIEFLPPDKSFDNAKKINQIILEVKIQSENIDKNSIEQKINFRETRFSKYCIGMNFLLNG